MELEKTFPPGCPGSTIQHEVGCPFAAAAEEKALAEAYASGELTASSTIAESIVVKERARTNLDFFVQHVSTPRGGDGAFMRIVHEQAPLLGDGATLTHGVSHPACCPS